MYVFLFLGCIIILAITILGAFLYATRQGTPIFTYIQKKPPATNNAYLQIQKQIELVIKNIGNLNSLVNNWNYFFRETFLYGILLVNQCLLKQNSSYTWLQPLINEIQTQQTNIANFQLTALDGYYNSLRTYLGTIQPQISKLVDNSVDDPTAVLKSIADKLQTSYITNSGTVFNTKLFTNNAQILNNAITAYNTASNNLYADCFTTPNGCSPDQDYHCLSYIKNRYDAAQYEYPSEVFSTTNDNIVILYNMIRNQEAL